MQWYSLYLGNGADSLAPTQQIQERFFLAFASAGGPGDMSLFSRINPEDGTVTLYFSPAAESFAKSIPRAIACAKPAQARLGLLVGDQGCWAVFFPSEET